MEESIIMYHVSRIVYLFFLKVYIEPKIKKIPLFKLIFFSLYTGKVSLYVLGRTPGSSSSHKCQFENPWAGGGRLVPA